MAIYVTHHNFAEVYIFEFLPLCANVREIRLLSASYEVLERFV